MGDSYRTGYKPNSERHVRAMRLGILGGTFDPVHYGHLLLAESCREQLRLDAVWFLPAAVPPHKQLRAIAPEAERVEMLLLATSGNEAFSVCRHEIERGGVNYTVDTLEAIKAEDPSRDLFFLMGADSLGDLATWRDAKRICELAIPAVVARSNSESGSEGESLDWNRLAALISPERLAEIRACRVHMPRVDLSASDIRRRVASGKSIRYQTTRAVEKYIETHRLYRDVHR
jgi:nicotinate-nucleotide adenylyltransferase